MLGGAASASLCPGLHSPQQTTGQDTVKVLDRLRTLSRVVRATVLVGDPIRMVLYLVENSWLGEEVCTRGRCSWWDFWTKNAFKGKWWKVVGARDPVLQERVLGVRVDLKVGLVRLIPGVRLREPDSALVRVLRVQAVIVVQIAVVRGGVGAS